MIDANFMPLDSVRLYFTGTAGQTFSPGLKPIVEPILKGQPDLSCCGRGGWHGAANDEPIPAV
ncbi:MAG: hypothetical protein WCE51_12635 [Chthoniobacterales bacterium]